MDATDALGANLRSGFSTVIYMDICPGTSVDRAGAEIRAFCEQNRDVSIMTVWNGLSILVPNDEPEIMRDYFYRKYEEWQAGFNKDELSDWKSRAFEAEKQLKKIKTLVVTKGD